MDGELVGGCDIITEMYNSGELHDVLGVAKPDRTPPEVTITDKAAENIRAGMQGHDGLALHMSVDNEWRPAFTLQAPQPGAIVSQANGIELHFDLPSAQRAQGAMIDWIDAVDGSGLDVSLPAAPVPIKRLQPAELKTMLEAGTAPLIVDVRSPDDRQQLAPIEGAIGLDKDMLTELQNRPKDTAIVFVCNVGNSSMGAAEHFRKLGFSDVYNLEGGMQAWSQQDESGSVLSFTSIASNAIGIDGVADKALIVFLAEGFAVGDGLRALEQRLKQFAAIHFCAQRDA